MSNNTPNNLHSEPNTIQAVLRQKRRISPFWLLPFIAFCIGALLFFQIVQEQGETIRITFSSGEGLVANKTQIRYQGLQIGVVKKVNFSDELKKVEVTANIYPEAKSILRENSRFWLVKPSASLAGVSGLDALVSGNYITVQPGDGETAYQFVAAEEGPIAQVKDGDLLIHLLSDDLGSISQGASVYFKKMPVGTIYDFRFTSDQQKIEIDIVIDKAYAHFVKQNSRFWNISGIQADFSLAGAKINVESLNAVVQGAVAFDSPNDGQLATMGQRYTLYRDLQSAKRGLVIEAKIPFTPGLIPNITPVIHKNSPIGVLTEIGTETDQEQYVNGKLLIDPNMQMLFTENSSLILRDNRLNLSELNGIGDFFKGPSLEIIASNGEIRTEFTALRESELLLKQPDTLLITLNAEDTYGLSEGEPVYYNNITIGQIISRQFNAQSAEFKIAILGNYRHLINGKTQFISGANFALSLGVDGVKFEAANPTKWLQGGIRIHNPQPDQSSALQQYPLYKDLTHAEHGITTTQLTPTITLNSQNLPSIDKGSLVLYRQFEVGKILAIHPQRNQFAIDVFIYPKYRHLLSNKSRFWVESAAQIDITPQGISIQATPLGRSLKGAISFDNGGNGNLQLYPSELRAKSAGHILTFTTDDATNLTKGMPLRYLGMPVGEIETIQLDQKNNTIIAKALMNSDYMNLVAKEGSKFTLIAPQITSAGVENLDSLLQPYIDIELGKGKSKTQFTLRQPTLVNKYQDGLPLILETNDASNLAPNAPILYRGVEVGRVNGLALNKLGDRALVYITISHKHKHLVRENSEFWIASGYSAEINWRGVEVNTGSMDQLLKGAISFATPSGKIVRPAAKPQQRYLLQQKRPAEAKNWNQGVLSEEIK